MRGVCSFLRYGFLNFSVKPLVSSSVFINSYRNTYVLQRKFPPSLSKETATRFKRLRSRNFIYEVVQDTNAMITPDLRVVLTTFVEGVGDIGDVISADPHYARNHLLLPQKAVYATQENVKYYLEMKKDRPEQPKFSSIYAGMTIRYLERIVVPVQLSAENSWTLEPWHVRIAFRKEGIIIPENAIKLPETAISGPDPTKEGKDFAVLLTMNSKENFTVRCRLFHLKVGLENLKLPDECYLGKGSPLLEEQKELLDSMQTPQLDDDPSSYISLRKKYNITLIQ